MHNFHGNHKPKKLSFKSKSDSQTNREATFHKTPANTKIPLHPECPEALLAEPSMLTLIHLGDDKFHETGIIDGPLDGLPFTKLSLSLKDAKIQALEECMFGFFPLKILLFLVCPDFPASGDDPKKP